MGEDIAAALAAPLTALSLVPIEATVTTAGTRRVLRVLVDRDVSRLDAADASSPVHWPGMRPCAATSAGSSR